MGIGEVAFGFKKRLDQNFREKIMPILWRKGDPFH